MAYLNYKIKEHGIFNTGYTITDEEERLISNVEKRKMSLSEKAIFYDDNESIIYKVSKKFLSFQPTYFLNDQNDKLLFRIFKTWGFKKEIFVES